MATFVTESKSDGLLHMGDIRSKSQRSKSTDSFCSKTIVAEEWEKLSIDTVRAAIASRARNNPKTIRACISKQGGRFEGSLFFFALCQCVAKSIKNMLSIVANKIRRIEAVLILTMAMLRGYATASV